MKTDRDALYSELDTAIKISNATTKIQVNFLRIYACTAKISNFSLPAAGIMQPK